MTAQAAGPRPATSTLSIPSCATAVPPALPRPAPYACREPDRLVRGLPGQLGGPGDAAHDTCALSPVRDTRVSAGPPAPREEGSDVQAWTQAALPQEERRQPRQAAQRLRARADRERGKSAPH